MDSKCILYEWEEGLHGGLFKKCRLRKGIFREGDLLERGPIREGLVSAFTLHLKSLHETYQ